MLFNLVTLPGQGINWWVTVLLGVCSCGLPCMRDWRKLRGGTKALIVFLSGAHLASLLIVDLLEFGMSPLVWYGVMPLSHAWKILAGAPLTSGWSCPTNDWCMRLHDLTFDGIVLQYVTLCLRVEALKDTLATSSLHLDFCSSSQTWPLRACPLLLTSFRVLIH